MLKKSLFQALALSDIFLSKLGVVQENVDDSASAAQVIYICALRYFYQFL